MDERVAASNVDGSNSGVCVLISVSQMHLRPSAHTLKNPSWKGVAAKHR